LGQKLKADLMLSAQASLKTKLDIWVKGMNQQVPV
jgi:hypothetical protein